MQSELGMFKQTPVQAEGGSGQGQRSGNSGGLGGQLRRGHLGLTDFNLTPERGAMAGFEGAGAEWGDGLGGSGENPG